MVVSVGISEIKSQTETPPEKDIVALRNPVPIARRPLRGRTIAAGVKAHCPFCLARTRSGILPKKGERVLIISGYATGTSGIVTKPRIPLPGEERFLIRPDGAPQGIEKIVRIGHELFLPPIEFKVPEWFPPFSRKEIADLEEVVVAFCDACCAKDEWNWDRRVYLSLVYLIWRMRVSISADELWHMLSAHGAPAAEYSRATEMFQDGLFLLVYANGRKPIKKKRLKTGSMTQ